MSETVAPSLLDRLLAWAQASSLVALPFVGTVPSRTFAPWLPQLPPGLSSLPRAGSARQADLLVVVGEVSHKLCPVLQRTWARMPHPSYVLHIRPTRAGAPPDYATVERLEEVLPVDVVIEGDPPDAIALERGLAALKQRIAERRARR